MKSGTLLIAVRLDQRQAACLMDRLGQRDSDLARDLFRKVYRSWMLRGLSQEVAVPVTPREAKLLKKLGASNRSPSVVNCRYLAIYRHPDFPQQEVKLRTADRPPKRRTFRIAGAGRKKFTRMKLYRLKNTKESDEHMARSKKGKSQTKSKNTKAVEDDEDELEGLEELEDLEELEEEDVDEPDDDEEEEDEEPAPKAKKSKKGKGKAKADTKSKKRKRVKVEVEDEDDEEDEEEETPKRKKKGKSAKSTKKGKKGKGTGSAGKTTAEATGGVGTAELAEAASEIAEVDITGRDVRVYLRREDIPKDEDHGRYVWPSTSNKEFKKLAKAIAKEYAE